MKLKILRKVTPDWGRRNWDVAAQDIKCRVDALDAMVYIFEDSGPNVLANDPDSARDAFSRYIEMENGKIRELL